MNHPSIPSRATQPVAAFLALVLAACSAVGPDYAAPQADVPSSFRETEGGLVADADDLAQWWKRLGDPVLDSLVERATHQGLDLEEALLRVNEARAQRGLAAAQYWPVIDGNASYRRLGDSENSPLADFAVDTDRYGLSLDATWEIDLWGRVRRLVEAADADLGALVEAARDVAVAVAAETATNYVELRSLQERIAIARNNETLQQQTLALVQSRFEAGLVGERDVAQARSNLASTRARVPALEAALRSAENRLAVLLGLPPGALAAELAASKPIPVPPASVAVGVPADVLRRRPDVRAAERSLAAETARIGVATADLYPQLTLVGTIGYATDDLGKMFEADSGILSVGPSIRWNLFDGGAVRANIAAQDARAQQALVRWQRAVLVALEQSENAMTAFVREQVRSTHLAEAAAQSRAAVGFAETQYREGLTDFQNVLDSERASAELEDQVAQSRAAITSNVIALYKALGGGWQSE